MGPKPWFIPCGSGLVGTERANIDLANRTGLTTTEGVSGVRMDFFLLHLSLKFLFAELPSHLLAGILALDIIFDRVDIQHTSSALFARLRC